MQQYLQFTLTIFYSTFSTFYIFAHLCSFFAHFHTFYHFTLLKQFETICRFHETDCIPDLFKLENRKISALNNKCFGEGNKIEKNKVSSRKLENKFWKRGILNNISFQDSSILLKPLTLARPIWTFNQNTI